MKTIENLTTLAIDTSCDETSVAVVKGFNVLSNVLPSQIKYHAEFGGVVPSLAKLAHTKRIDNVVNKALKIAKLSLNEIDYFAVTYGPGLAIALEVGVNKAKSLAIASKKPLVAVNHMEGHLLSAFLKRNSKSKLSSKEMDFPAMGFLISGGHTEMILVNNIGEYKKIGETQDDSCGECYDKCGRMLGFGYPAGAVISKIAKENRKDFKIDITKSNSSVKVICKNTKTGLIIDLPIPMANSSDLNFSYSGLKTAFSNKINSLLLKDSKETLTKEQIITLTVAFEACAIEQLKIKLHKALKSYKVKQLWLGGGVIASARLKSELRKVAKLYNVKTFAPYSKNLTGDNAAMIALAANLNISLRFPSKTTFLVKNINSLDRNPSLSL